MCARARIIIYTYCYMCIYTYIPILARLLRTDGSDENRLFTNELSPHITAIEEVDPICRTSTRRSSPDSLSYSLAHIDSHTCTSIALHFVCSFSPSLPPAPSSSSFRIYIGAGERLRPQVRLYIIEHVPARDMLHAVRPPQVGERRGGRS